MLLDTNIYLDMIVSRNDTSKAGSYDELLKLLEHDKLKLIVPKIIKEEVKRHLKGEIVKIGKSVKATRKSLREMYWINNVDLLNDFNDKLSSVRKTLGQLDDEFSVNMQSYLEDSIKKIDTLFNHSNSIEIIETNELMNNVRRRKLYKKAPSHIENKDSTADSLIVESLINIKDFYTIDDDDKIFFISRNISDFSQGTNKEFKENLHSDIKDDLASKNLNNIVEYRILFTKTIYDDFKSEAEEIDILTQLLEDMELEEEANEALMIMERINMDRESVGLMSLGSDSIYLERIYEMQESYEFISTLETAVNDYRAGLERYIEYYYDVIEKIKRIDLKTLKAKVDSFNNLYKIIPIENFEKDEASSISSYIDYYIGNVACYGDSLNSIQLQDYIEMGDILLMKNVYEQPIRIDLSGHLDPRNDDTDNLELNFSINGRSIESGTIEVYYGYMNFDLDGGAADGAQDSIDFYFKSLNEKIESTFSAYVEKIEESYKKLEHFIEILDI
jgi:hypothetical protein